MPHRHCTIPSPLGPLRLLATDIGLCALDMENKTHAHPDSIEDPAHFAPIITQLNAYFAGTLKNFDLTLDLHGTPFQLQAWHALTEIPYGKTLTYSAQATAIGKPAATRAIGLANGRNPVPIIVPCHRVIGKNGTLTGYSSGLHRKQFLLKLEEVNT